MKILCVHGIGHQEERSNWRDDWQASITQGLHEWDASVDGHLEIHQFAYDALFAAADSSSLVYLTAVGKLLKSWAVNAGERDIFGLFDKTRWTVGMVAQWVALDDLRTQLRANLAAEISAFAPDVIIAHSLGSLVTYDTLRNVDSAGKLGAFNGSLITLGCQVAHPSVCDVFAGRIEYPAMLSRWWNLFNENDLVFTREFDVPNAAGFAEVLTPFEFPVPNHDADHYLSHEQTRDELWRPLALGAGRARSIAISTATPVGTVARDVVKPTPSRPALRALLVGIAEYANPEYQLNGPVNDVFLVSQTLQEMGVEPDAIRVALNERATAAAIRERLQWLLAGTRDGDTVFFYFSGHGAQVPAYGRDAEVDHIDECLVPYDFNWQQGNAIFDDEFAGLYSQLPYGAKFVAMLDCCHAGGMQRGLGVVSGAPGVRSIALPDDIRHRALRWDRNKQMWLPREQLLRKGAQRKRLMQEAESEQKGVSASAAVSDVPSTQVKVDARLGEDGTLRRIGRGQALRGDDTTAYNERRDAYKHKGPYMPILLEACTEKQSAYEYQHGSVSYGAFTYGLCEALNMGRGLAPTHGKASKAKKGSEAAAPVTFEALVKEAAKRVKAVASGPQTPQLVCPEFRRTQPVI